MKYAFLTDTGKVREHNEDCVNIVEDKSKEVLMIVADGMGGHRDGEVASSIAEKHITSEFEELETIGTKEDATKWMQKVVSESNVHIYEYTALHPESSGMGTTIVMALLTKDYLLFGNIGDSGGYVLKDKSLQKITIDHTLVNLLVKSGELTPEEAANHPRKNVLMRALGANMSVDMDIFDVERDVDGISSYVLMVLSNMLDNKQIARVLLENTPVENRMQKLIYKANNRGGTDNISVAYLERNGK
jgi:serine/threonine protein phosphatase PrpC